MVTPKPFPPERRSSGPTASKRFFLARGQKRTAAAAIHTHLLRLRLTSGLNLIAVRVGRKGEVVVVASVPGHDDAVAVVCFGRPSVDVMLDIAPDVHNNARADLDYGCFFFFIFLTGQTNDRLSYF